MINYNEAESYLLNLQFSGIKLGLDQANELFEKIGSPQNKLKFIHLAGTNGKGSTGAMIASCLTAAGFKVGFYTSPHLFSMRERFRINGKAISESRFAQVTKKLAEGIEQMKVSGSNPTFFEATTAMAALYFAEENVDFVLWETGLGGRFDATNIITPECSVITGISIDHESFLGDTLEKIAFEKAGIIKNDKPAFIGKVTSEVENVFRGVSEERNAPLLMVDESIRSGEPEVLNENGAPKQSVEIDGFQVSLSLLGDVQVQNAKVVIAVLKFLSEKYDFSLQDSLTGLSKVNWPGRFQVLKDGTVVDGAHNTDGANVLVQSLKKTHSGERITIVFGNFADKDSAEILKIISEIADEFVFVPITSGRECCSPEELSEILSDIADIPSECAKCPIEGVESALKKEGRVVVAGSLYLAGEVLTSHLFKENVLDIY